MVAVVMVQPSRVSLMGLAAVDLPSPVSLMGLVPVVLPSPGVLGGTGGGSGFTLPGVLGVAAVVVELEVSSRLVVAEAVVMVPPSRVSLVRTIA